MNFCKECDDMLYVKIKTEKNEETNAETNSLIYLCKTCYKEYPQNLNSTNCVYHVNYDMDDIKKESLINKYTYYDPTLPKAIGIKCPNKECPGKTPNIVYINYDNKQMKYIYICLECANANIEPHIW